MEFHFRLYEKAIQHSECALQILDQCLGDWNDRYKNLVEVNNDLKFAYEQITASLQANSEVHKNGTVLKAIDNLQI
jgi:hypothetical protein